MGNSLGQFYAGLSYSRGNGVDQSDLKAFEWYLKSSSQGNASAMFNIGHSFENGEIKGKCILDAIPWYEKAILEGHPYAESRLGRILRDGDGIEKDLDRAFKLLSLAASKNRADAQCCLAEMILDDSFGNVPTGLYWLRRSVKYKDEKAPKLLLKWEKWIAKQCAFCGKKQDLKLCKKCKSVYYCNKECQVSHWKSSHKFECMNEIKEAD